MTNPTPHGQVPEALIDLIDAYAETRHRCGRIHNAETEGARNAVIEALSEVQALSAAPEAFLKSVIALCSHRGYSPANIEAWDKYDKWIADLWRQAESMLAASPTPPAEQQAAPKAAPTLPEGWADCTIEFGNDGPEVVAYGPKRMMNRLAKWLGKYFAQVIADAATKAAPGEPSDADIDAFLDSPGGIEWVIADKRERYRLLVRAVLAKWAAPQQEAQEPCPTCAALARTVMLDQVSFDRKPDCYGIRQITDDEGVEEWEDIRTSPDVAREEANDMMATGRGEIYEVVPLYTAPQPAPDCHHRPPCDECAALAAQGGKDA